MDTFIANDLQFILLALNLDLSKEGLTVVANDLSVIARRVPPWSWRYLNSIIKGHKGFEDDLPNKFINAVHIMKMICYGKELNGAEEVVVYAHPNTIASKTYIPPSVRVTKCYRPGCPIFFVKTSPNHRFHSTKCRDRFHEELDNE